MTPNDLGPILLAGAMAFGAIVLYMVGRRAR
jgi:hypothetical protein